MISKEKFIKTLDEVQRVWDYSIKLNSFLRDYADDGYLMQPDCTMTVISLLHDMFGEADADDWIRYYCFELDFGRDWRPGNITAADGSDIPLSDASDLYDLLIGKCN